MSFTNVPQELKQLKQWVCWALEQRPGQPKPTKVPKNALGNAATTRPEDWMTFDAAVALAAEKKLSGIGFVFTKDDPYVGVDLDGMLDPKSLAMLPAAQDIVQSLSPAYTEISQSGKGIHIIVKGTLPAGARRKGPIEVYSEGRYFAITGNILAGSVAAVPDRTEALGDFHRKYLSGADDTAPAATVPAAPTSDAVTAVLAKVDASPDARFFTTLYEFGETRPGKSASESDMAMAAMLAKYTRSAEVIEAVMKASALRRPKWNEARPIPGRKDGTILRRVIAAALRQVPERKHLSGGDQPIRSVADIIKNGLPIPPAEVAHGIAWLGRITLMAAREGLGKSTLFGEAAAAVSAGRMFLGKFPTVQGPVLWVLSEEAESEMVQRAIEYDAAHAGISMLFVQDHPSEALAELVAGVASIKPRLVIIDTLHSWAQGAIERSSQSDDWQTVMSGLDAIAHVAGGPSILMSAQATKETGEYRDSTAIGHGVDVVLTLCKIKNDEITREIRVNKARASVHVSKMSYQFQQGDPKGEKRTGLYWIQQHGETDAAQVATDAREAIRATEEKILAAVRSGADSINKIKTVCHMNKDTVQRVLDTLQLRTPPAVDVSYHGSVSEKNKRYQPAAVLDPNAVATASGATM